MSCECKSLWWDIIWGDVRHWCAKTWCLSCGSLCHLFTIKNLALSCNVSLSEHLLWLPHVIWAWRMMNLLYPLSGPSSGHGNRKAVLSHSSWWLSQAFLCLHLNFHYMCEALLVDAWVLTVEPTSRRCDWYSSLMMLSLLTCLTESVFHVQLKGCRLGRSDKVSLWCVTLLINTRFRFIYFRISNC